MAQHHLTAISVAVMQGGQVVYSSVHGEVVEGGRPADGKTVFRAASLGKPVFAYLVLQLVDEGILNLDNPVDALLPGGLAAYEHYSDLATDPRHRNLTVRSLLSQQSGLPNWHRQGPVRFAADPGTHFGYSGEGYSLLQLVVEERTGRSVNDLVREKVFEPLEMTNSSFLWENRFDEHFAVDLGAGLGRLIRQSRRRPSVAGSLITNGADYARFLLAVMDGRGLDPETHSTMLEQQVRITSRSIFSPPGTDSGSSAAMQLAWTPGWGRFTSEHGEALFHLGREEGCEGYAVAFLEPRTALVVMSVSPLRSTFTGALAASLIGDTYSPLDWLEFWRTVDARPSRWLVLVLPTVLFLGITVAVIAGTMWLRCGAGSCTSMP
jgi:CubicO group peptidase (beta-lactamase class C family)